MLQRISPPAGGAADSGHILEVESRVMLLLLLVMMAMLLHLAMTMVKGKAAAWSFLPFFKIFARNSIILLTLIMCASFDRGRDVVASQI